MAGAKRWPRPLSQKHLFAASRVSFLFLELGPVQAKRVTVPKHAVSVQSFTSHNRTHCIVPLPPALSWANVMHSLRRRLSTWSKPFLRRPCAVNVEIRVLLHAIIECRTDPHAKHAHRTSTPRKQNRTSSKSLS
jgi:hypothetical protein